MNFLKRVFKSANGGHYSILAYKNRYHITTHTPHNFTFFRSLKPPLPIKLTQLTQKVDR